MSEQTTEKARNGDRVKPLVGFSTRNSYIVAFLNIIFCFISKSEVFALAAIIFGWLPVVFGNKTND